MTEKDVAYAYDGDATVWYNADPDTEHAVFERIIQYMRTNNGWAGESIMQSDDCQIEAAPLLAEIVDDIIQPELEWNDE